MNMTATKDRAPIDPKPFRLLVHLKAAGYDSYLVGGCVRDHLLGRPIHDYDIATAATPDRVAALFPDSRHVGSSFGVSLVDFEGERFEVATFRSDGAYSDGGLRIPAYTLDIEEDLKHRDFTINALRLSAYGSVIDSVHGLRDLLSGFIKCVGSAEDRFREDPLRMLRAIRLACQLDFTIEAETFRAMKKMAADMVSVAKERVSQELTKILVSGHAVKGFMYLAETGLIHYTLPEVAAMMHVAQNPKYHPEGDVWTHTMKLLAQLEPECSPTLAWATLLHDVGKPNTLKMKDGQPTFHGHENVGAGMAMEILERLRMPGDLREAVCDLVAAHMKFRVVREMRRGKLMRFLGRKDFAELLALHRMDALAGSGNLDHYDFCVLTLQETPEHVLHPVQLVSGKDLIALGVQPGEFFRFALHEVRSLQHEGEINDREGALRFLTRLAEALVPKELTEKGA